MQKTVIDLSVFATPIFEGAEDVAFVEIDSIVGKPIYVEAVKPFSNDKGEGVHILFTIVGDTEVQKRTCTHSVGVCATFSREEVKACLEAGNVIKCQFERGKSQKDATRTVYRVKAC